MPIYCYTHKRIKAELKTPEIVLYSNGLAFIFIGSFQPASSKTDSIEFKTKVGGSYSNYLLLQSIPLEILKIALAMFRKTTNDLNILIEEVIQKLCSVKTEYIP